MDPVSSTTKRFSCRLFLKDIFFGFVTEYETPKIVMIHSYTITTLLRFIQTLLLLYSLCYLLVYRKGYQTHDTSVISSITLKVKGIGYITTANNHSYVFDGTDYIIPPSENNAIFIMTSFIETDQSRSTCAESSSLSSAICTKDSDCQNRTYMADINGRWTGRCLSVLKINTPNNITNATKEPQRLCEIQGWCPVENDVDLPTVISEIPNFTIFIKNFIEFPAFDIKHKNIAENLKPCVFDPIKHTDCPIFRLSYILNEVEKNPKERNLMLLHGAVIRVKLDWDCNLDRSIKSCKALYSFARLDAPSSEEKFSFGFNFRFASHWKYRETYLRSLRKAYGLRFIISVSGKAGKFDFITLTLNTGSLVGIFGLATFVCDYILLNLTKKAAVYREQIFQRVHSKPALLHNAISCTTKTEHDSSVIFENPNTIEGNLIPRFRISESFETFPNTSSLSSVYIDHNQIIRLPPNLGLTNMIN